MKKLLALFGFGKKSKATAEFKKYMGRARTMMKVAREDKKLGLYHCAKLAVESALSYRAAAHASLYYNSLVAK